MAVTSIDYELMTQDATVKSDGALELIVNARLEMEGGDGIITALSYSGLPKIGDEYNHFGEYSDATLEDAKAKILTNTASKVTAQVQLRYRKPPVSGGQNGSGGSSQDPEDTTPILTPGYRFLTVPVKSAEFRGFFNADKSTHSLDGAVLDFLDTRAPCNAAGTPNLPPSEKTIAVPTLTLERYFRTWNNAFDDAVQTINDSTFRIIYPDESGVVVYDREFDFWELLLNSITATQRQFGKQIWYWLKFEFWKGDWDLYLPNEGISQRESLYATGPKLVPIRNEDGAEIPEPVPLDKDGLALDTDDDMLYTRWRTYEEYNFDLLGLTF